jgi:hypothetical protein
MPGRGGAGRRQAFFSYSPISLKIVRKLLGVESTSKSHSFTSLTCSWPLDYLEKCVPAGLTRTWYIDDDPDAEWHLDYHANPKRSTRTNEHSTKKSHIKATTKQLVDNPSPIAKPLSISNSIEPSLTIKPDDPNIKGHHVLSQEPSSEERERQARFDAQFGPIGSPDHRYVSKHMGGELTEHVMDEPPYFYIITTHLSYTILIAFGRVRDFFGIRFKRSSYKHITDADGYAALNSDWSNFYFRRLKLRMNDCFSRPYDSQIPCSIVLLI